MEQRLQNMDRIQNGFTLIELLVSMSLFAISMTVIGVVFVDALSLQRQALNFQQVEENASFLLESIAKEIRVSEVNAFSDGCGSIMGLLHPVQGNIIYEIIDGLLTKRLPGGQAMVINSNTIEFTNIEFCFLGSQSGDNLQPRVTIIASILSINDRNQSAIDIQTTVSPRFIIDD